jgi:hypothetical protein
MCPTEYSYGFIHSKNAAVYRYVEVFQKIFMLTFVIMALNNPRIRYEVFYYLETINNTVLEKLISIDY